MKSQSQPSASKLKIGTKIAAAFLGIGLITTVATALIASNRGTAQLREKSYDQLKSIRTALQGHISEYLSATERDLASTADSLTVREGLATLTKARSSLMADMQAAGLEMTPETISKVKEGLSEYYEKVLAANLQKVRGKEVPIEGLIPLKPEAQLMQYVITVLNPSPVGSKTKLLGISEIADYQSKIPGLPAAFAKTTYAKEHEHIHSILDPHRERNAYYDVFLVDLNGDVVYTDFKELDFQGNLLTGSEKDTGLGQAYAAALKLNRGEVFFTTVSPYAKSYDAPAIFTSSPVFGNDKKLMGALIYQLPLDRITTVMTFGGKQKEAGLGQTGEAYLVSLVDGPDKFKVLSESRFLSEVKADQKKLGIASDGRTQTESAIGTLRIETQGSKSAASGSSGEAEYPDYRNQPVLGSFSKLDVKGANWAILSEIDAQEAFAPAANLRNSILYAGGGLLLLTGLLAWLFSRFLTRPITLLRGAIADLAAGQDDVRSPVVSSDEVGEVATAFNSMIEERNKSRDAIIVENRNLQRNIQDLLIVVSDASDGKLDVRAKVTEGALGNLADALNLMFENVGDLVKEAKDASLLVSSSAGEIEAAARQLSDSADLQVAEVGRTNDGVANLGEQADIVLQNCQTAAVASGIAHESAGTGAKAVQGVVDGMNRIREHVQANAKKIKRLGDRSLEISQIVKFISEISAKTDILALNAAIEASRAGEQGRGFTVVAEEVRGLADRTRNLTAQIETLVNSIQTETAEAVVQMEEQTSEVERGAQTAVQAGQALEAIVTSSQESANIVEAINRAAAQQATSTENMRQSVENIDRLVTNTQAQVSQANSISQSLAKVAQALTQQLDLFEVTR